MNNVVSLKPRELVIPDDLLTLREIEQKYGYKYELIYKYIRLGDIPCYYKGRLAVSESDLFGFINKRTRKWRA